MRNVLIYKIASYNYFPFSLARSLVLWKIYLRDRKQFSKIGSKGNFEILLRDNTFIIIKKEKK